jgi:hypothetical protein
MNSKVCVKSKNEVNFFVEKSSLWEKNVFSCDNFAHLRYTGELSRHSPALPTVRANQAIGDAGQLVLHARGCTAAVCV